MALLKFDPSGQLLWSSVVGNGKFDMEPRGVNIDGQGNPFWAGSFAGKAAFSGAAGQPLVAAGSYDAFVARFDPNTGTCQWVRRVGGPGNDYLYACFVSNSGNVYAGGSYTGAISFEISTGTQNLSNAGGLDGFIVKFNPLGEGIYASRMGSSTDDEVKSIEYMGGDLIACGYMGSGCTFAMTGGGTTTLAGIGGSRDGWAARVNSVGEYVWVKNFGSVYNDEAQAVTMDHSTGDLWVAAQVADAPMLFNGTSYPGYGNNDIVVVGWNFYTQAPIWASRKGSNIGDIPTSIKWDGLHIVLTGYAGGSFLAAPGVMMTTNGGYDGFLMRYEKNTGTILSGEMIGGTGRDQAMALWCNTATRESIVGGVFQNTVSFPSGTRSSAGLYDGFIARYAAPAASARFANGSLASGKDMDLKTYPVPARELVTVETSEKVELLTIEGQHVAWSESDGTVAKFNLKHLAKGLYIVRSTDGKTGRVVKE
jgi:hypothetical protein